MLDKKTHGGAARPDPGALILVVDDFEDNREMYTQFLRFSGYRVAEAVDGLDALSKAAALRPDLIVMDLSLPRLDGWEATRRLKGFTLTSRIPVIALSCHDVDPYRRDAWTAGCSAYLMKPCLPDVLLAEIRRVTKPAANA
jgi:two-component system, cell cycle response regulator DivK